MTEKGPPANQPATGSDWNQISAMTWPNPPQPWTPQPISSCNCPYCEQLRRGSVSAVGGGGGGGYSSISASAASDNMNYLYQQIADYGRTAHNIQQALESRIVKLEGLVKVLVKALGVNEEFLTEVGKGGA